MRLLAEKGANIEAVNMVGNTPLIESIQFGIYKYVFIEVKFKLTFTSFVSRV